MQAKEMLTFKYRHTAFLKEQLQNEVNRKELDLKKTKKKKPSFREKHQKAITQPVSNALKVLEQKKDGIKGTEKFKNLDSGSYIGYLG